MSAIRGYPTSQKLVKGIPSNWNEYVTIQPQDEGLRNAADVVSRFAFRVGSQSVPRNAGAGTGNGTGGGGTIVADTATPARIGDFVRFETGAAEYLEIPIVQVSTDAFMLGAKLNNPPGPGDSFFIMRYGTQRVSPDGSQIVTLSLPPDPQPIAFSYHAPAVNGVISNSAYTELVSSLPIDTKSMEIANSTGKTLYFALGAASSEVDQLIIPSSGIAPRPILLPQGARISVKAVSQNATIGELIINFYG